MGRRQRRRDKAHQRKDASKDDRADWLASLEDYPEPPQTQTPATAVSGQPQQSELKHAGAQGRECPACVAYVRSGADWTKMAAIHWESIRGSLPDCPA